MQLDHMGHNAWFLKNRFSCPSIYHAKTVQTDYFYVLDATDRWPRDFFLDENCRPKILIVESQWRDVYWSEPVDFVYERNMEVAHSGLHFLEKLRESKPSHPTGYNCVTTDNLLLKIPFVTDREHDRCLLSLFPLPSKRKAGEDKGKVDDLVAKLIKSLKPRDNYIRLFPK